MIETKIGAVVSDAAGRVTPETPAAEAAQRLRDPAVPALVVLDAEDHVVGMVTESDFVVLVAEAHEPATVSTIMSTPAVTISPELPIGLAADRMNESGVKHLPVVDDCSYRGLVSLRSLAPFLSPTRLDVLWKGASLTTDTTNNSGPPASERLCDWTASS